MSGISGNYNSGGNIYTTGWRGAGSAGSACSASGAGSAGSTGSSGSADSFGSTVTGSATGSFGDTLLGMLSQKPSTLEEATPWNTTPIGPRDPRNTAAEDWVEGSLTDNLSDYYESQDPCYTSDYCAPPLKPGDWDNYDEYFDR